MPVAEGKLGFKDGWACGGAYAIAKEKQNEKVLDQLNREWHRQGFMFKLGFIFGEALWRPE